MNHLVLAIRPATYLPYRIEGDEESRIPCYHASAREAEEAVRTFCRTHGYTATVRVYTPHNRLWSKCEVDANGMVRCVRPRWLARQREAA